MAPEMKLSYFDIAGRVEPIRLVLYFGGVEFEDERLQFEEWPARKMAEGGLQVPFLYVDGQCYSQSIPILRYACKLSGLVSSDPLKALKEDMVVMMAMELLPPYIAWKYASPDLKPEAAKTFREELPDYIAKLETTLRNAGPGPFATGDALSIADFAVWCSTGLMVANCGADETLFPKDELAKFSRIKDAIKNVQEHPKVVEYYSTRPEEKKNNVMEI